MKSDTTKKVLFDQDRKIIAFLNEDGSVRNIRKRYKKDQKLYSTIYKDNENVYFFYSQVPTYIGEGRFFTASYHNEPNINVIEAHVENIKKDKIWQKTIN